jgi:DNA-directed RNA polymerase II subunit RPB2
MSLTTMKTSIPAEKLVKNTKPKDKKNTAAVVEKTKKRKTKSDENEIQQNVPKKVEEYHSEKEIPSNELSEEEFINEFPFSSKKILDTYTKEATSNKNTSELSLISHLGDYIEEPFSIIESYFRLKYLERLVRHQIESYNHFITYQIQKTIQMFNPVVIRSENDVIEPEKNENGEIIESLEKLYYLECRLSFVNFKLYPPQIHENNGATKTMLPQEAKLRNFTYASSMTLDIEIEYVIRDKNNIHNPKIIKKVLPKINIGKMPIMIKSSICVLNQNKHINPQMIGECKMDCGGYFILKGSEKTVLGQERTAENKIYCFDGKNTSKWSWFAEIKSVPDYKCISPKQIEMMIAYKNNGFGNPIFVNIPRIKQPIELFVVFRALGIISDKKICKYILLDIEDQSQDELLHFLQASIIDSNKYNTQEIALKHMTSYTAYTPINMTKENGAIKKREFLMDILNNDLFPHCKTTTQKAYLIGYMAKKLILTSLGYLQPDDRDSYLNKRIELTGTLLNNLFRNYFNKLVKEMQKQIVREINTGSWRTTEDFENIINMTNIYKIVKSTTIENGINRALSTGDFSIKQSNSSKVGVAQVLNRLTYLATLSHLRRINTPIEKSGELIAPRKLHNTTWGFLCPVETPEGQSIGIVKNISYLTHITTPIQSSSLYEYVEPFITKLEENIPSETLFGKVKVFVNGCWIGITETPVELYTEMKEKKYKGIINIYTSIVFDYKLMEIRICNDGGRMVRPLLRVKNNKVLITKEIINDLESKKLEWNDLLTDCKINDSVIEYIDPEEQNYSMIAMKNFNIGNEKKIATDNNIHYLFTHCEIHASTIFGVLASCIPFPEHNQSPRNCYQTAMCKQAIGIYTLNFDQRMDKTSYVLTYPCKPLVDTRLRDFVKLNTIPSGFQVIVAIMSYTGYNQEDSILINKGSIDRGLFAATIYHTEKDEDKNIIRDEIIRCKPEKSKTKGIKFGNYDKLNEHGFIEENELVENRDVIIAKIIPIKENRNDPTKTIKYEDQSKTYRTTEETYIDKNYTGRNGDGYNFAKVRTRTFRKPVIGDKFACSLPTQEVLTDHGWVQMCNIDISIHKVCTLDSCGNMLYEFPTQKFEYDFEGQLYSVSNKQAAITCTLNHKLYLQTRSDYEKKRVFHLMEAQEIIGKQVRFQKSLNNIYPDQEFIHIGGVETYKMDDWLQLLGMFISDGSSNKRGCIRISAFKERKLNFNSQILTNLGIEIKYNSEHGFFSINKFSHPKLYEHLDELSVCAPNKYLPDYVWTLSKRQSIVLLEALVQGDGCIMKMESNKNAKTDFCRYYTTSQRLANDVMRLATHCGWSGNIMLKEKADNVSEHVAIRKLGTGSSIGKQCTIIHRHDYYCVGIIKKQNQPWINKKTNDSNVEQLIDYIGKVYCIEMPTSHLYYFRENIFAPSMLSGNSLSAQKGTAGLILSESDMPFTKSGLRPDLIINPHAIPSRMTIAQLKETILGKVLIELGMFGDGTSFGKLSVYTIIKELQKLGYESYGNEIMYNGMSGEQLETSIFIGPVYYQRLKHMVNDKQHSRSIGPMVNLTRQPAEGRSRDGGFRIGEMERDVMIAHGMSRFCKERLYDVSDKYSVHICSKCGMIASYNDGNKSRLYTNGDMTVYMCHTCNNMTDFAKVEIPYSYKLLSQELQTINVVPRLITE